MKSRPHVNSTDAYKVKKVRELTKEGDYLKEKFYSSKLSNNTDSIFGYKHFIKPNDKFKAMLDNPTYKGQYGQWEGWNMDVFKRNCRQKNILNIFI